MTDSPTSKQWRTPWRASGFAVYDASGELVVHTGITGNRSMPGEQLEQMASMIAELVNRAADEPRARYQPGCLCTSGALQPDDNCPLHGHALPPRARHWTCGVHGDFDANIAVGCPDCMRESRELLRRALTELREHVPGSRLVEELADVVRPSETKRVLPAGIEEMARASNLRNNADE